MIIQILDRIIYRYIIFFKVAAFVSIRISFIIYTNILIILWILVYSIVRDRPFNLQGWGGCYVFFSFRIFFSDNTRVRILIFFCRAKREIFFQNLTLGYMTKTLNQIIFFPPPKSEYFFSNIGNQNIFFRKKPIAPPGS